MIAWAVAVAALLLAVVFSLLDIARGDREVERADAGSRRARERDPSQPLTSLPEGALPVELRRRLVRENQARDDQARWALLRSVLAEIGEDCDRVASARMAEPGQWLVECGPRLRYQLTFGDGGELVRAARGSQPIGRADSP